MSDSFRIRIRGLDDATAIAQAAVREGLRDSLNVIAARGEQLVKGNIASPLLGKPPAVAFGILENSIVGEVQDAPGLVGRAVVFAQPPADQYAGYVESGTGPHFPPVKALLLWVMKKFSPADEKEARSIAFLVARAISRRGTFGHGMFARAFQTLRTEVIPIARRKVAEALQRAGVGR